MILKRLSWLLFFISMAVLAGFFMSNTGNEIASLKELGRDVPQTLVTLHAAEIIAMLSAIVAGIYQLIQIFNFKDNELNV